MTHAINDLVRRAAGTPVPTQEEREEDRRREREWAALTPAQKLQQAIAKAAARVRAADNSREQTR